MNFFRGIPNQLDEAARLDGANQFQIMTQIFLPLSKSSFATVALFKLVGHWNSWFDGLIYSNLTQNYPLQSYLQAKGIMPATASENMFIKGKVTILRRTLMLVFSDPFSFCTKEK